jgi:hypothetical protein
VCRTGYWEARGRSTSPSLLAGPAAILVLAETLEQAQERVQREIGDAWRIFELQTV